MTDKLENSVKATRGDATETKSNVPHRSTMAAPSNEVASTSAVRRAPADAAASTSDSANQSYMKQQIAGSTARIRRELSEIMENPPPNCQAKMVNDDLYRWSAILKGPENTVYEAGHFKLDIRFPLTYPFKPPRIRFSTRIYHCNVDSRGAICLDVLNERWSPVMTISKVLLSIWVLIGECNPEDPLVMGIADQYKCNRKEHDKTARSWTERYATPKENEEPKRLTAPGDKPKDEDEPSMAFTETSTLTLPSMQSSASKD